MKTKLSVTALLVLFAGVVGACIRADDAARERRDFAETENQYINMASPRAAYLRTSGPWDKTLHLTAVQDLDWDQTNQLADLVVTKPGAVHALRYFGFTRVEVLGRDEIIVVRDVPKKKS
jgi:hypothetical protein